MGATPHSPDCGGATVTRRGQRAEGRALRRAMRRGLRYGPGPAICTPGTTTRPVEGEALSSEERESTAAYYTQIGDVSCAAEFGPDGHYVYRHLDKHRHSNKHRHPSEIEPDSIDFAHVIQFKSPTFSWTCARATLSHATHGTAAQPAHFNSLRCWQQLQTNVYKKSQQGSPHGEAVCVSPASLCLRASATRAQHPGTPMGCRRNRACHYNNNLHRPPISNSRLGLSRPTLLATPRQPSPNEPCAVLASQLSLA
ncbi:hypothetical protein HDV64DRAFT_59868 [Trichoderma sp. TUCIM 5745]